MSGHCPRCGVYAEEDDDRLCASCKGDRATPQPPTLDELRDWHAEQAGWKNQGRCKWYNSRKDGIAATIYDHPFPPTLDGAASAMPEGWWWTRDGGPTPNPQGLLLKWSAMQIGANRWGVVTVPDTGNEVYDRYLLAQRAHEAEVGK